MFSNQEQGSPRWAGPARLSITRNECRAAVSAAKPGRMALHKKAYKLSVCRGELLGGLYGSASKSSPRQKIAF